MKTAIREIMKPTDPSAPVGGEGKTLEADWGKHTIRVLTLVERDGTAGPSICRTLRG
jgi:hypothetical protein